MQVKLDGNQIFSDAIAALKDGQVAPWTIFLLIALVMSPWIIPAASKALAEHRSLSHKREQALLKIRNSSHDRATRSGKLKVPKS